MMTTAVYEPSLEDAIRVYLTAAAHKFHLPIDAIDQSGLWQAVQTSNKKGVVSFGIINPNDAGLNSGIGTPPVAICVYDLNSMRWRITLSPNSERVLLVVRADGDGFVVVDKEGNNGKYGKSGSRTVI